MIIREQKQRHAHISSLFSLFCSNTTLTQKERKRDTHREKKEEEKIFNVVIFSLFDFHYDDVGLLNANVNENVYASLSYDDDDRKIENANDVFDHVMNEIDYVFLI